MAVGKMYVERYFPESSKQRMLQLVHNLQKALGQRIDQQTWMSAATKKASTREAQHISHQDWLSGRVEKLRWSGD